MVTIFRNYLSTYKANMHEARIIRRHYMLLTLLPIHIAKRTVTLITLSIGCNLYNS